MKTIKQTVKSAGERGDSPGDRYDLCGGSCDGDRRRRLKATLGNLDLTLRMLSKKKPITNLHLKTFENILQQIKTKK